jgi:hypothetical protein
MTCQERDLPLLSTTKTNLGKELRKVPGRDILGLVYRSPRPRFLKRVIFGKSTVDTILSESSKKGYLRQMPLLICSHDKFGF